MNLIVKFLQLEEKKKILIIKATLLLLVVRLWLYFFSFKSIYNFIRKERKNNDLNTNNTISKTEVIWSVEATSNHLPFISTCLIKALAAYILLSNYNHQSNIKIGITKPKNNILDAHAWIESNGEIIMGKNYKLPEYKELEIIKS